MRREQPVRPPCEVPLVPRPHDDVKVVRHDANRERRYVEFVEAFGQQPLKGGEVRAIMEQPHLVVATIEHVIAVICDDGARGARHAAVYEARSTYETVDSGANLKNCSGDAIVTMK